MEKKKEPERISGQYLKRNDGPGVEEKVHSWMKKSEHYFTNSSEDDLGEAASEKLIVRESIKSKNLVSPEPLEKRKISISAPTAERKNKKYVNEESSKNKSRAHSDDVSTHQIMEDLSSEMSTEQSLSKKLDTKPSGDDCDVKLPEEKIDKIREIMKSPVTSTKPTKILKKYCTDPRKDTVRQTDKLIFRMGPVEKSCGKRQHRYEVEQDIEDNVEANINMMQLVDVSEKQSRDHSSSSGKEKKGRRGKEKDTDVQKIYVRPGDENEKQDRRKAHSNENTIVKKKQNATRSKPDKVSDTSHAKIKGEIDIKQLHHNTKKENIKPLERVSPVNASNQLRKTERSHANDTCFSAYNESYKAKKKMTVEEEIEEGSSVKRFKTESNITNSTVTTNQPDINLKCQPKSTKEHVMKDEFKTQFEKLSPYVKICIKEQCLFHSEIVEKETRLLQGIILDEMMSICEETEKQETDTNYHLDSLSLGTQLESTFAESMLVKRALLVTLKDWMNERPLEIHNMQQVDWKKIPKPTKLKKSYLTSNSVKESQKDLHILLNDVLKDNFECKPSDDSHVKMLIGDIIDQMFRQVKQYMNFLVSKSEKELLKGRHISCPQISNKSASIPSASQISDKLTQSKSKASIEQKPKIDKESKLQPVTEIPLEPRLAHAGNNTSKKGENVSSPNTREILHDFRGSVDDVISKDVEKITKNPSKNRLKSLNHKLESKTSSHIDDALKEAGEGFLDQLTTVAKQCSLPTMVEKPIVNSNICDNRRDESLLNMEVDSPQIAAGEIYSPTRPTETEELDECRNIQNVLTKRKQMEPAVEIAEIAKRKKSEKEKTKEKAKDKLKKEKKKEKKEKRKKEKAEKRAEEKNRKRHKSESSMHEERKTFRNKVQSGSDEEFTKNDEKAGGFDQTSRQYRGRPYRRAEFKGPFGRYRKAEILTRGRKRYSVNKAIQGDTYKDSYLSNIADVYQKKPVPNFDVNFDPTLAPPDHFLNPFSLSWGFLDQIVYQRGDILSYIKSVVPGDKKFSFADIRHDNSYLWALILASYTELFVDEVEMKSDSAAINTGNQDTSLNEYGTAVKNNEARKKTCTQENTEITSEVDETSLSKNKKPKGNPLMQAFRQALEMKKRGEVHSDDHKARVQKLSPALAAKKPKPRSNRPLFKPPIAVMMERQAKGLDPVHGDGEGLRMFCDDGKVTVDTQIPVEAVVIDMAPSAATDSSIQRGYTVFQQDLSTLLKDKYDKKDLKLLESTCDPLCCLENGIKHLPALSNTSVISYYELLKKLKMSDDVKIKEKIGISSDIMVSDISLPPSKVELSDQNKPVPASIQSPDGTLGNIWEDPPIHENPELQQTNAGDIHATGWSAVQDIPASSGHSNLKVAWKSVPASSDFPDDKETSQKMSVNTGNDKPDTNAQLLQSLRQSVKTKRAANKLGETLADANKINAKTLLKRVAEKQMKVPPDSTGIHPMDTTTSFESQSPISPNNKSTFPVFQSNSPETKQSTISEPPHKFHTTVPTLVSPNISTAVTTTASSTGITSIVQSIVASQACVRSTATVGTMSISRSNESTSMTANAILQAIPSLDMEVENTNMDTSNSDTETSASENIVPSTSQSLDLPVSLPGREAIISQPPTIYRNRAGVGLPANEAPPGTAPLPIIAPLPGTAPLPNINQPPPPPGVSQGHVTPPPLPPGTTEDVTSSMSNEPGVPVNTALTAPTGSDYEHLQRQAQSFAHAKQTHNFTQPPPGYTDSAFPQSFQGNYPSSGFPGYPPPPTNSYDPWNQYNNSWHQWQAYYQRFPNPLNQYQGQSPWGQMPMDPRSMSPWNHPFPSQPTDGSTLPPTTTGGQTQSPWMTGQGPPGIDTNDKSTSQDAVVYKHRMYVFNQEKGVCKSIQVCFDVVYLIDF